MVPLTFLVKLGSDRNSGKDQVLSEFYKVFEALENAKKYFRKPNECKKMRLDTVKVRKETIHIDLSK